MKESYLSTASPNFTNPYKNLKYSTLVRLKTVYTYELCQSVISKFLMAYYFKFFSNCNIMNIIEIL